MSIPQAQTITKRDTILVVDDTPDTLGFLTRALDHAGMTVLVATGGESALRLLTRITPDLILLDAVMPDLDGFETCRHIKEHSEWQDIPIIFMTGLSDSQDVVRGLEAGGVDYVTKPIILAELLARIRVHLGNARTATRSRAALDATGRYLAALDASGQLIWCTPQAAALIASADTDAPFSLPKTLLTRLQADPASLAGETSITHGGKAISIAYLSRTGPDEFLFRLREQNPAQDQAFLRDFLSLTTREAEVLIWIARGKSNRDISDILGISPRTVNKHLEQIFVKLGVENRASATGLAVSALARRH